jgi:hypothetical protein
MTSTADQIDNARRRELILAMAAAIGSMTLSGPARAAALAVIQETLALPEPDPGTGDTPSFDLFFRLSKLVTGRSRLDPAVARRMHDVFNGEPWVRKHAETAYAQIVAALRARNETATVAELVARGIVQDGEKWFVSHLLTTWYLGVYYHPDRDDVRITFDKALMHELLADYRPVPGFSDRETGFWHDRPDVSERRDGTSP